MLIIHCKKKKNSLYKKIDSYWIDIITNNKILNITAQF